MLFQIQFARNRYPCSFTVYKPTKIIGCKLQFPNYPKSQVPLIKTFYCVFCYRDQVLNILLLFEILDNGKYFSDYEDDLLRGRGIFLELQIAFFFRKKTKLLYQ